MSVPTKKQMMARIKSLEKAMKDHEEMKRNTPDQFRSFVPKDEDKPTTCGVCGKYEADGVQLQVCSACKMERYCSTDCQKRGWADGHKLMCMEARYILASPILADVHFMPREVQVSLLNEASSNTGCLIYHENVPLWLRAMALEYILQARQRSSYDVVNACCPITSWSLLHRAAKYNCADGVRLLASKGGADLNLKTSGATATHSSPLMLAAIYDKFDAAVALLEAGADANSTNRSYETPMCQAKRVQMLDLLEQHGGNPRHLSKTHGMSDTPLWINLIVSHFLNNSYDEVEWPIPPTLDDLEKCLEWCASRGVPMETNQEKLLGIIQKLCIPFKKEDICRWLRSRSR